MSFRITDSKYFQTFLRDSRGRALFLEWPREAAGWAERLRSRVAELAEQAATEIRKKEQADFEVRPSCALGSSFGSESRELICSVVNSCAKWYSPLRCGQSKRSVLGCIDVEVRVLFTE